MADNNGQLDTDGYYGDDDADSEEIDLSFLDQDEKGNGETGAPTDDDTTQTEKEDDQK